MTTLYGIGVGPGDPELMTVKAARILKGSPVIAYPKAGDGEGMARRIAAPYIAQGAEELAFAVPMAQDRAPARAAYDEAAAAITARLDAGRDVAVLCEGDPLFYGSFMFLHQRLHRRYPVEVVPGVSSIAAAAASAGWPLAARNDVLTVVPAPLAVERLKAAIMAADAVAILKVGRHFDKVRGVLDELALIDRAVLVADASTSGERIAPLAALQPGHQPYFSTILVYKGGEPW